MKATKFSEAQIAFVLKPAHAAHDPFSNIWVSRFRLITKQGRSAAFDVTKSVTEKNCRSSVCF